ncbi:MAG TPA: hypothetical protein VJM12_22625 [Pyrinomonadaceae bacterium]|nr:hypothetical protein [Pyrinomonadaceae bacterium]
MGINRRTFIRSTLLLLPAIVLILAVSIANGQTSSGAQAQDEVATVVDSSASNAPTSNAPVFTDYRGIKIGMTAKEVRAKLDGLEQGTRQDFLRLSDQESAQIYYDDKGTVIAISVDYFGDGGNAPSPSTVLGVALQPKPDGSVYQLNRYPEAGYWVSYNRTAGDKPIVSITMQKM